MQQRAAFQSSQQAPVAHTEAKNIPQRIETTGTFKGSKLAVFAAQAEIGKVYHGGGSDEIAARKTKALQKYSCSYAECLKEPTPLVSGLVAGSVAYCYTLLNDYTIPGIAIASAGAGAVGVLIGGFYEYSKPTGQRVRKKRNEIFQEYSDLHGICKEKQQKLDLPMRTIQTVRKNYGQTRVIPLDQLDSYITKYQERRGILIKNNLKVKGAVLANRQMVLADTELGKAQKEQTEKTKALKKLENNEPSRKKKGRENKKYQEEMLEYTPKYIKAQSECITALRQLQEREAKAKECKETLDHELEALKRDDVSKMTKVIAPLNMLQSCKTMRDAFNTAKQQLENKRLELVRVAMDDIAVNGSYELPAAYSDEAMENKIKEVEEVSTPKGLNVTTPQAQEELQKTFNETLDDQDANLMERLNVLRTKYQLTYVEVDDLPNNQLQNLVSSISDDSDNDDDD